MEEKAENREEKNRMKEWKGIIIALIAGACAIACVTIFSQNIVSYKKTSGSEGLSATGSANCDFEADLIVWRGSFSGQEKPRRTLTAPSRKMPSLSANIWWTAA